MTTGHAAARFQISRERSSGKTERECSTVVGGALGVANPKKAPHHEPDADERVLRRKE